MAQHEYLDDGGGEVALVDVGELETDAWLAMLVREVEPVELPEPVAAYLNEARQAGEV